MNPQKIYPGLVVRLEPTDFTRSRFNFVPNIDPKIGGVYRVGNLDPEGLVYLEDESGPFLQDDLVPASPTELHLLKRIPQDIDKRDVLAASGADVPTLKNGDRVACIATWSLPEFAHRQGWPIYGEPHVVESVEDDGVYFRLKGFRDRFPAWHFKKLDDPKGRP